MKRGNKMSRRAERIADRLPRFYKSWEMDSTVAMLIQSISEELDKAEEGITDLLKELTSMGWGLLLVLRGKRQKVMRI
jgi:hypothetical protein